jgi:hypothetical protein
MTVRKPLTRVLARYHRFCSSFCVAILQGFYVGSVSCGRFALFPANRDGWRQYWVRRSSVGPSGDEGRLPVCGF